MKNTFLENLHEKQKRQKRQKLKRAGAVVLSALGYIALMLAGWLLMVALWFAFAPIEQL